MRKNKKFKKLVRPASSSSHAIRDSDKPPSECKANGEHKDSELYQYETQSCEFCDAVFYNKYDHFTHNAHHIIIPLLNQTVHQCTVCLFYFTSHEELISHSAIKHGITSTYLNGKAITKKSPRDSRKKGETETDVHIAENNSNITKNYDLVNFKVPSILESMLRSKSVVRSDDNVNKIIIGKNGRNEGLLKKQLQCENITEIVEKNIKINNKNATNKSMRIGDTISKATEKKDKSSKTGKGTVNNNNVPETITNGDVIVIDDDDDDELEASKAGNKNNEKNGSGIKSKIMFEDDPDLECSDNSDNDTDNTHHADIMKPAATTVNGNYLDRSKCLDIEIIDLNCDDSEKTNHDDYILPDDGFFVNRLLFPDNTYILPDKAPELIVPDLNPRWIAPVSNNPIESRPVLSRVNLKDTPIQNSIQPLFGKHLFGSKVGEEHVSPPVTFKPSIHYNDLMSPGLYGCKRCRRKFPSRFQLISHEKSHIKIKSRLHAAYCNDCPLCDRYIVGNYWALKRHIKEKHPGKTERSYTFSVCQLCGLRYRKHGRHVRNYHNIYVCRSCGHRFQTENERTAHVDEKMCGKEKESSEGEVVKKFFQTQNNDTYIECESVKVLKLCELCLLFKKNKAAVKYVEYGEWSELGKRRKCEGCQKEFFNLKLVKRIHKWTKKEEFGKKNSSMNETRLKNMQTRLKKCNKLWQC